MAAFWKGKRVLVTGGAGFLGSHLVDELLKLGAKVVVTVHPESRSQRNIEHVRNEVEISPVDLRILPDTLRVIRKLDAVFHLAARVAGVRFNLEHPAQMYSDNILPALNVLEAVKQNGIERALITSSACVYPRAGTIPFPEEEGFLGEPEPTNAGYGWAKRAAELAARFYHQEYGTKVAIVRPFNIYGPRDHFGEETAHVLPALIFRLYRGDDPLVVWGSGRPTRSFTYVSDVVHGMLLALEHYPVADAVNLGTDEEISIRNLVSLLRELSGRSPKVSWDRSKPDGQPRRNCDTRKALEKIGFRAHFSLREGLQKTLAWYEERGQK